MKVPVWVLLAMPVFFLACAGLQTPGSSSDGTPTPDIPSTIRAAVAAAVRDALPGATPDVLLGSTTGEIAEPEATIVAMVQATVEALLATPPVPLATPSAGADPTPDTLSTQTAVPVPTATVAPIVTANPTTEVQSVPTAESTVIIEATPVPTPTPSPTPTLTPTPTPTASSAGGCQPAANGSSVTAWIDAGLAASVPVENGGFVLFVEQPESASFAGKIVSFKIDGLDAAETGVWMAGGGDELDLTVTRQQLPNPTPGLKALMPRTPHLGGLLAQRLPPHVFLGTASICVSP